MRSAILRIVPEVIELLKDMGAGTEVRRGGRRGSREGDVVHSPCLL